ncbi:MAG: MaoC family dehydratase [Halobacteria archaeon]|nr:MaoC family dehydratase [Halobacteria archaeon]
MSNLYFEDLEVGEEWEHGSYTLTQEEILEFAERYDPQPFHTDEEAAQDSIYGGLIASGWHTASVAMRMYVEGFLNDTACMGSRGVDKLRWHRPVRPGDTLSVRVEVLDKEDERNPNLGLVHIDIDVENQDDEVVMSMIGLMLMERREPSNS